MVGKYDHVFLNPCNLVKCYGSLILQDHSWNFTFAYAYLYFTNSSCVVKMDKRGCSFFQNNFIWRNEQRLSNFLEKVSNFSHVLKIWGQLLSNFGAMNHWTRKCILTLAGIYDVDSVVTKRYWKLLKRSMTLISLLRMWNNWYMLSVMQPRIYNFEMA